MAEIDFEALEAQALSRNFPVTESGFHHTRGVYNSGDFVDNGVDPAHLQNHIKYNTTMRFGRALFVDGVCVWRGYLSEARCKAMEAQLQGVRAKRCTAPYR